MRSTYKKFKEIIDKIKSTVQIDNSNAPMTAKGKNKHDEMDLANPYGKMTCLTLYLYSMELGQPPLY